jgi:hypothetical protein
MGFWSFLFGERRSVSTVPPADASTLARVRDVLFPPMERDESPDGTAFVIDRSADSNLQTALNDLYDGHNDMSTHAAIGDVMYRLGLVRRLLGAYSEFPLGECKYVIVDTVRRDPDVRVNDIDA